jgi:hypothetical protein
MSWLSDGRHMGSDKEMVMSGVVSRMRGGLLWGLAAGIVLLMAGDHAQTASPANSAIDPYEILDLQVRPNAIIVLDSSGSMREFPDASGLVSTINTGDLSGDDSNSKLKQAKDVLRTIVDTNKAKVNFQFGKYESSNPALEANDRYLYRTTDPNAATLAINAAGNGASAPGISRAAGTCTGSPPALPCTGDSVALAGVTYYYLTAQRFWNGETVNTSTLAVTPATPTKTNPATVTLTNGTISATFTFQGVRFNKGGAGSTCNGFQSLVSLAPCDEAPQVQFDNIEPYLSPEVAINADGSIKSATPPAPDVTRLDGKPVGIRAGGSTPIAATLTDIRTNFWAGGANYWAAISAKTVDKRPKTFVIFVTDGDDTCAGGTQDQNARTAATQSEALFMPKVGSVNADGTYTDPVNGPTSSVDTFFIAFGGAASQTRSDWIAWGGSGLNATAAGFNWATDTNATLQTKRDACVTCRDATSASNPQELADAIQDAINRSVGSGEFSSQAQGSVTESVFEYGTTATDPITRYASTFPVLVRSTFKMPGFEGQLKAYNSASSTPIWDAGQVLKTNVLNVLGATQWTFAQLHGGVSNPPTFIPSTTAKIRRRIFTTSRNGVGPANVALWPPDTTDTGVAPSNTVTYQAGSLDGSYANKTGLAIGGATLAQLQTDFKACMGSNLPADCTGLDATRKLARALKEAREMILAYTAGAKVVLSGGNPVRNGSNELLYVARTWLLAESTIATPAIVGPPGEVPTVLHSNEWVVYRDGPRNVVNRLLGSTPIEDGFGLRNPDRDDPSASTGGEQEPVMTVVYVGANDMFHAFRAGPQECTTSACPVAGKEGGGEELYAFVPFDLLPKLKVQRATPQSRDNPVFMIASSLRFGDVFIPGAYTGLDGKSYTGQWRTMMYIQRGAGGKYITALDITGPGPFTRKALETRLPDVRWTRGNPDRQDGTTTGPPNFVTNGSVDLGVNDVNAYETMGETWSIPSLDPVDPATADTFGREWILWMGSGFSDVSTEGRNLYTIDAATGDVLRTVDVGSNAAAGRTNFVNAGVAGFIPAKLAALGAQNAADGPATAGFVGDLHGRLFRLLPTDLTTATTLKDFGTDQPIGVAPAALDLLDGTIKKPHVYGVTGNDNRIFDQKAVPLVATPPFKMFGLRDDGASITDLLGPSGTIDFPERFRGTTQPLVFNVGNADENVVFFIGTQFDPAGTSPDPAQDPCISTFDTILFAVNAISGNAAYDLQASGDDRSAIWRSQKVQNIKGQLGAGGKVQIVLDTGLLAGSAPPPPPPPTPQATNALPSVFTTATRYGSPVCKW